MVRTVVDLKNITKIYGTKIQTQVLFDISLAFEEGSFNSIIGQSGSGKSTLLNILGTLLTPTSGEVVINGTNTKGMKKNDLGILRNETIGFVFQNHLLIPEFTAYENILMPYRISKKRLSAETKEWADYIIEKVGLSRVKDNRALDMSGGQQQRAAIARALINRPPLMLADEPTGNLDSDTTATVYDILREINKEIKTTFVIITHDRRIAEKADRIIEITDGKISLDMKNT